MTICDLNSPTVKLMEAMKMLQAAHAEVADQWDDAVRQRFDEEFLRPLEPKLKLALAAVEELQQTLLKAEKECGVE